MAHNLQKIRRALISVSDKTGLDILAQALNKCGVEIISTGGTRQYLEERQIPVTPIETVTGNPEAFGGRMKTISFEIASALLFRRGADEDEAERLGIKPIDLVVCNLYPFERTALSGGDETALVEQIDIGGVTMIRAAAKNYNHVAILTDPSRYAALAEQWTQEAVTDFDTRKNLSLAAFRHTARYDAAIANRLEALAGEALHTPVITTETAEALRYGENPHQQAWLYKDPLATDGLAQSEPLQGKALSYNNLLDADAAWRAAMDIAATGPENSHAAVIVKHLNPCGIAVSNLSAKGALENAWAGDPVSSFGGIICLTTICTEEVAAWLDDKFVEIVIAPGFEEAALGIFAKKKNLRILTSPAAETSCPFTIRSVSGGWLVQQDDCGIEDDFKTVTKTAFGQEQQNALRFGIAAAKHLRSNAIALVQQNKSGIALIGAGMGNPNRLVSTQQAVEKARENGYEDLSQCVLVSDAFFPFADNIELAAACGIRHIIQPGGSIKDDEVIAACDQNNMAMVFTGRRHFRH